VLLEWFSIVSVPSYVYKYPAALLATETAGLAERLSMSTFE